MKKLLTLLVIGLCALSFNLSAQTTPAPAIDTVAAKNYVGKYKMKDAPFEEIIVTLKDGKLWGEAVGQGVAELAPTKETDVYEVVGYDGKLEFVKKENSIVGVKLSIQGALLEGDKQP